MANDDEDRKVAWSSWFAPGDIRQASNPQNDVKRPTTVASPSQAQETSKSESNNPLIAFKHFVDGAVSAVTNFNKTAKDAQEACEDEHDKAYKRWTGAENTRHSIHILGKWITASKAWCQLLGNPSDEARATARMLLLESARKNSHVSPSKIVALFEDPASQPGRGDDYPRWLSVEWFRSSKDSPVNLEADPALAKYDTKWRNAFEDLLTAALDKPMTSREKFGYRGPIGPNSTWRGPGLDWMLSLQCRGILPPQLPTMYSSRVAASDLFVKENLSDTMLGRWCNQHSPISKPGSWEETWMHNEMNHDYYQLLEAIDTPAPEDTTSTYRKLEAMGIPFKNESLPRHTTQHATREESTSTGGCPDELGHAVSEAIKSLHDPDTELDIYEQMYNDWLQDSTDQSNDSENHEQEQHPLVQLQEHRMQFERQEQQRQQQLRDIDLEIERSGARCPDELGRAVGNAARQEAARAFADEENGLTDHEEIMTRVEQRRAERKQIQQELDASAWRSDVRAFADDAASCTESEKHSALNDWASSKLDLLGALERTIEQSCEMLRRDQDSVKNEHRHYINVLAEQAQLMQNDYEELAQQLAEVREQLEQKDRQSSLVHPQKSAPAQAAIERPQVLSTLTTTETTRLPDGSVKTTVVLKRRFAGGLEETQESTQTSFEEPTSGGQEPSKKGWFWS